MASDFNNSYNNEYSACGLVETNEDLVVGLGEISEKNLF